MPIGRRKRCFDAAGLTSGDLVELLACVREAPPGTGVVSQPFLFISHVSEDRGHAAELVCELEQRGVPCWIAPRDVKPGEPYDDQIAQAIDDCTAVLLIFSEHCNTSDYIRREITVAGEARKLVLPFRIEDVQPKRGLRIRLADLHWIDGFIARENAIQTVVRSVVKDGVARSRGDVTAEERLPTPQEAPTAATTDADESATASSHQPSPQKASAVPTAAPSANAGSGLPDYVAAILEGAGRGIAEEQYYVGLMRRWGWHAPQEFDAALALFRDAASQQHPGAMQQIGLMHLHGRGVPKDAGEAARWFGMAVELGHVSAPIDLARLYERGEGVEANSDKALSLHREALARGAFWAQRFVRRLSGRPEEVMLSAIAEGLDPDDPTDLPPINALGKAGLWVILGWANCPEANPPLEMPDMALRARAGEAMAQYVVGRSYQFLKNDARAVPWLRLAAAQDFPPALYELANLARFGADGVKHDPALAAALLERACSEGYGQGCFYLGLFYKNGEAVPRDAARALLLFEEATARGYLAIDGIQRLKSTGRDTAI